MASSVSAGSSTIVAEAARVSNQEAPVHGSPRRKQHVKTQQHVDTLKKLAEERMKAKKMLKEIRAKSKVEQKKHKRLMSKAAKLSIEELHEIAEMKKARITMANSPKNTEGNSDKESCRDDDGEDEDSKSNAAADPEELDLREDAAPEKPAEE